MFIAINIFSDTYTTLRTYVCVSIIQKTHNALYRMHDKHYASVHCIVPHCNALHCTALHCDINQ